MLQDVNYLFLHDDTISPSYFFHQFFASDNLTLYIYCMYIFTYKIEAELGNFCMFKMVFINLNRWAKVIKSISAYFNKKYLKNYYPCLYFNI